MHNHLILQRFNVPGKLALAQAIAAADSSVLLWGDTPVSLLVQADEVGISTKGSTVGELRFAVGESTVKVPLELSRTIDDPGAWWRLTNPVELF